MARSLRTPIIAAALLLPAVAAAGVAAGLGDPEPGLSLRELLVFLHVALFVLWLGPDFGVFLWSSKVANPALSVGQRLAAAQIMGRIDLIPRVAMSLMLTVGGVLSEYVGIEHPAWQLAGIVLLGPVWLALVLLTYLRQGTEAGATLARIDVWFRWALMAGIVASVTWSTVTGRLAGAPWVGWKLLIFAALLLIGALLRVRIRPFVEGVRALATSGPNAEVDRAMQASLAETKTYVLAMWTGLLLAALLGVVQPGVPLAPAGDSGAPPVTRSP
jgi:hypothetical protein